MSTIPENSDQRQTHWSISIPVKVIHIFCSFVALWRLSNDAYMYVALNPNEKLHILCALSWPSGGHFVCLMTVILVYRLSNIMFVSHRGVYNENPTWLLPKSRICFHFVDNYIYINFLFSQMEAILDFAHYAISKVLLNHFTMSGILENPMVDTKIILLRPFCRKWCQFIA